MPVIASFSFVLAFKVNWKVPVCVQARMESYSQSTKQVQI